MINKRQQLILNYINEKGEVRNSELQEMVGDYSAMTLWRDLTKLENEGRIIRYRGGAVSASLASDGPDMEINFIRRIRQNTDAKEQIAAIAADFLRPDHTCFLDAGTTVFTLVSRLSPGNYNFITSAVNTAAELAKRPNCDVTQLGGQLNANTVSCSGPQAERMLEEINIDIAIMATSG
ncbi:MAG: DeoR/GlpR transcriptional regulator, partial [Eubacterium sp.]|nr:DeoR/GlpR transcriptional regulator [Eubacterium sp.]